MVLLIIIPFLNGYKSLGILTQHFQVQTQMAIHSSVSALVNKLPGKFVTLSFMGQNSLKSGHPWSNMACWACAKWSDSFSWWVSINKHQETRENCEDSYGFRSSDPQSPGLKKGSLAIWAVFGYVQCVKLAVWNQLAMTVKDIEDSILIPGVR